jgi:hypothetical protein
LKFSIVHKRSFFSTFSCVFCASAYPSPHRIPDVFVREYVYDCFCLTADVLDLSCFYGVSL